MIGRAYTPSETRFIRRQFARMPSRAIAIRLGRTTRAIRSRAKVLGVRKGTHRYWTAREDGYLRREFATRPTKEIAKHFHCKVESVHQRAHRLGLRKDSEYMTRCLRQCATNLQEHGKCHRYSKGHVPENKGLRRPGYSIGRGRMASTTFKKGQRPRNYLPVGTVITNTDGYLRRKIADDRPGFGAQSENWEFVHVRVWTDAHGPIPRGHRIWWKDRDHMNCAIENLELLSDKEHMARTTIHRLPPQLKEVIQLKGRVVRRIHRREKEERDGKKQTVRSA